MAASIIGAETHFGAGMVKSIAGALIPVQKSGLLILMKSQSLKMVAPKSGHIRLCSRSVLKHRPLGRAAGRRSTAVSGKAKIGAAFLCFEIDGHFSRF